MMKFEDLALPESFPDRAPPKIPPPLIWPGASPEYKLLFS